MDDETVKALAALIEVLKTQADTMAAQAQVIGQLHLPTMPALPDAPKTPDRSHPQQQEWRTWRRFCLAMQQLAGEVRRLQGGGRVSKVSVATRASVSDKTIARTMLGYGLDPHADWPPFDWDPDEPREWRNPGRRS